MTKNLEKWIGDRVLVSVDELVEIIDCRLIAVSSDGIVVDHITNDAAFATCEVWLPLRNVKGITHPGKEEDSEDYDNDDKDGVVQRLSTALCNCE